MAINFSFGSGLAHASLVNRPPQTAHQGHSSFGAYASVPGCLERLALRTLPEELACSAIIGVIHLSMHPENVRSSLCWSTREYPRDLAELFVLPEAVVLEFLPIEQKSPGGDGSNQDTVASKKTDC